MTCRARDCSHRSDRRAASRASTTPSIAARWAGSAATSIAAPRTRIVAISEAVKQDLVLFEGASASAIEVVPNGVDVDRFHPANRVLYRAETRAALGLTDKRLDGPLCRQLLGTKGFVHRDRSHSGTTIWRTCASSLLAKALSRPSWTACLRMLPRASSSPGATSSPSSASTRPPMSSSCLRSTSLSVSSSSRRWRAACQPSSVRLPAPPSGLRMALTPCSCRIRPTAKKLAPRCGRF